MDILRPPTYTLSSKRSLWKTPYINPIPIFGGGGD